MTKSYFEKARDSQAEEFSIDEYAVLHNAYGIKDFKFGADWAYNYRQAEIDRLKAAIEVMRKGLKTVETLHENDNVLTSTEYNHKSAMTYRKTIESLSKADEILNGDEK